MELYNIEVKLKDLYTGKECSGIIKELTINDENEYMRFQQSVVDALKDKSIFVPITREEFKYYLGKYKAVPLALYVDGKIYGAWFTVAYGNNEGSLHKDIGLKEDECHLNCNYETAILSPRFRGQGLNSLMSKIMTKALCESGFSYISATVEPSNYSSMGSILKDGYMVIDRKQKYGGFDRYIFVKRLTNPLVLDDDFINVECSDKYKISKLLSMGYVGTEIIMENGITLMKLHKTI